MRCRSNNLRLSRKLIAAAFLDLPAYKYYCIYNQYF
nr:MAG TPA: hypothetical protein [Bacteriophage sp.]